MAKFISGRQARLNVGVSSRTDNDTSLQVTGKVGIGTTNADGRSLYVIGDTEVTGVTTANRFSTGPSGVGFNIFDNKITGPSEILFDPAGVGDDSGSVRIKGDLFVDGTQTVIDSTKIELADFNVGIASTVPTNILLDGAGIGIGSESIRKNFTYDYSSDSLKSSENFDVAENKVYKVNEVERLSFNRLQVPHADITGIATAAVLRVTGVSTFDGLVDANGGATIDNIRIGVTNDNEIDTSTGALTIDSAAGLTFIDDQVVISLQADIFGTTYTNQAIYRSNGEIRISGGGPQTTRNNILFTNGGGLIIDGGSGNVGGVEIKGGGGNVFVTQGRVGIETAVPESTLHVNGDIKVVGVSTLIGYVDIDNSVDISQKLNVGSGLTVGGYTDLNDALDVQKSLVVGGGTTLFGYVDINNSVDISQKLNVGSGLTVGGYADLNDALDVQKSLVVGGGSTLTGYVDINNSVDVSGQLNVGSGLTVGGYVDINDSLDVNGNVNVAGIVTATRFESDQSGITNFFAGYQAGNIISAGLVDNNVIIGYQAGYDLAGSSNNVAIGYQTLYSTNNSYSFGNVAIGYQALWDAQGADYNVAVGYRAGYLNRSPNFNTFIGAFAASNQNVTGALNTFLGNSVGYNLTTGYHNTLIGSYSAASGNLVTSYNNVSLGTYALYFLNTGYDNIALGKESGYSISTGYQNVLVGTRAGYNLVNNGGNTIVGFEAGLASDLGDYNTLLGYRSGWNAEDDFLVSVGYYAGYNSVDSYASVYLGSRAGYSAQGDYNIAIGNDAMYTHDEGGDYNIALGFQALYQDGGASHLNIAIGYQALFGTATKYGIANLAIGGSAGRNLNGGSANVLIGNYAGDGISDGSSNVVIVGGATNTVDVPLPTGSNQLVIGSENEAWIHGNSSYYVGLGSVSPTQKLDVVGNIKLTGAIHGPTELVIDPAGVGDNTGSVRIKGNLYVDGSQFIVDSSTVELKDFQVGIASDVATNVLLDGAGIGIGSTNIRKTLTYDYSSDSLKSSEHFDLAANKTYKINEVEVLRDTQLTIPNAYVSGLGTITTLSGTNLTFTEADIDNLYVTTGIVTTLAGTNLTYTEADIDNAYVTTGIVTTIQGTDASYTNAYVNLGIVTTIAGTNLTYTEADIDNAYVTTGIVTTIQGTDASYTNAYVNVGVVTTISGTNLTYTNISNVGGISTLGVTTATNLSAGQLDVAGLSTFRGNVRITTGDFLNFGDTNNFSILFGGSATYLTQHTSYPLTIAGNTVVNINVNGAENAIVATANSSVDLYYDNSKKLETTPNGIAVTGGANLTGVVTATEFHTGASGSAIRIDSSTITGPSEITIDPAGVGDNTGSVRIKGDLFVDGEQFIVDSTKIELADFNVGIASTVASNALLDGAGIGIGSTSIRKTLTYSNSSDALKSSEHFDLAANKTYKINGTEVLRDTQLTIDNASVSGLGTITTLSGTNLTYTEADIDNAYVTTGIVTTIQGTDASYTNLYVNSGIVTNIVGTSLTYTNAEITNLTINSGVVSAISGTDLSYFNLYATSGIVTTIAGTNLTYTNADIDNAYVTTGIVTTLSGTDVFYTYGNFGSADIDNAYITSGIVTTLTNTHFTSGIATITTIYGDFDGELNAPGDTYYVQMNGDDAHTGDNINQAFASLAHALSVATSGDTILVGSGTFTEVFPLTIPAGVTVKGIGGLRGTFIQPTAGTKQNDCFLMNGQTTVEDLTIGNFFEPGVGFKFASGIKVTTRSPYVQRVTVLNKGSVTSATDPYGFDTPHTPPTYYKAGRGVYLDGSVHTSDTLEAAMLFNECTFITPNNIALEMTNGARTEWVNCFSYFADKGIYAHDGVVGLASVGYTRIKTGTISGSTPTTNDELYYLETNSVSATYNQVGTALTFTKVGHGLTVGDRVFADFTSGSATDGFYYVDSYIDSDNFAVTTTVNNTSGNVSYKEALGFGTVAYYDSSAGISSFINKGDGLFQLPTERVGKTITAFGDAALTTAVKKFGTGSLILDGDGDYAKVASNVDFGFGTGDLTLETFVRLTGVGTDQHILDMRSAAADDSALHIGIAATDVVTVSYGSTQVITGTTALTTGSWYHIAVSRDSGSTKLFIDGTQEGSSYSDTNDYGVSKPLVVGAIYDGTQELTGYIDEVRVSSNARYTGGFTPTTTPFFSDGNDKLIAHFDGITGSTSFSDSSIPTQDLRWVRSGVGIATATQITLADYQRFGGDMRSIGSASVFGNSGATADGPGSTLRLFAFNFGHIGSGKDFTQDISLVSQEDEVITLNNGKVYFASIDQSGDFRVGDAFYVNQEDGTENFGGQDFTLNSLSDLNITDGVNTTTITPTTLTVGNIQLSGNDVATTSGDLVINPSGISSTRIEGDLTVTGILNLGYSLLGGLDGDKGDITVANNFTTWTIDPNAVTFDKVQNVNPHTILGRADAGVGTVSALPVTGSGNVVLADAPTLSDVNITGVTTAPTLVGTNLTYASADIDNAYVTTGIVTTLAGTNLTYTTGDIDTAYITTGIVTTIQSTDATATNLYGVTGIVTTLAGTNLTYTNADIDNAYVTTGIVTTIQGTDASYTNAYVNTGIVTTIAGTNLNYSTGVVDTAYITSGIVTTLSVAGITTANSGGVEVTGIVTATHFSTGASGVGINIVNNSITGPSTIIIDPAGVGDNTGSVRIKGDFYVDGTQFSVSTGTINLGDFRIGIATDVSSDVLLDGAGITLGESGTNLKTFTFNDTYDSLRSSENLDVDSGRGYLVDGTSVLNATTLGSNVVNSSLTNLGTLTGLSVAGTVDVTGHTELDNVNVSGVSTFSGNVSIGSSILLGDNNKVLLGTGNDFEIYYDGGVAHIDSNAGQIRMRSNSSMLFYNEGPGGNEDYAKFLHNGAVELYYDGSKKFETTADGINVTGTTDTDQLNVTGVSTFQGNVYLGDDDELIFGDGNDLQIYHNGSFSYIKDAGTGALVINTNTLQVKNADDNESLATFVQNGSVQLYYDNSNKFETTAYGVNVTGTIDTDGLIVSGVATVTTISGTNLTYDTANITTISGTNLTYSEADIDTAYVTTGIVTTITSSYTQTGILTATSNTTLQGTLEVQDQATFQHNITLNAANKLFSIQNGSSVVKFEVDSDTGNTTIYGTLNGQGAVDFDSTLNVDGAATFNNSVTLSGSNNLTVGGDASITGDLAVDTDTLKVDSATDRVGVNQSSPAYALDVVGDINSSTAVKVNGVSVVQSAVDEALALAIALG